MLARDHGLTTSEYLIAKSLFSLSLVLVSHSFVVFICVIHFFTVHLSGWGQITRQVLEIKTKMGTFKRGITERLRCQFAALIQGLSVVAAAEFIQSARESADGEGPGKSSSDATLECSEAVICEILGSFF